MAKFVVVVDVEDPRRYGYVQTERQKRDIMVGLQSLLMDTPLIGISGDEYEVNTVPDTYFPF